MSRYRSYGKLDDPFVSEGDVFFQRMNSRLRPNQLQAGEVALSQNGRMDKDGGWQPRKGLKTFAGAITINADAVRLPFPILSAERASNVVTLVLADTPNNAFLPGENITIDGIPFTGDTPNGTIALATVNYANKLVTYPSSGADEVFSITASDEPLVSPGNSIVTRFTFRGGDPADLDNYYFTINDEGANEVYGATAYTLVGDKQIESYIFTATNNVCQIIRLRDRTEYKVRYPASNEINARCELVQAFDKIFIFRGDKTTMFMEPSLTTVDVTGASRYEQTITITAVAHGRVVDDYVTIAGLSSWSADGQGDPNGIYEVKSVPDADTLTVTFVNTGGASHTYSTSAARIEYFNDFQLVDSGDYTYPDHITDSSVDVDDAGVITFNQTAHGFVVGDELEIVKADAPLDTFAGDKIRVSSVVDADNFKFVLLVTEPVLDDPDELIHDGVTYTAVTAGENSGLLVTINESQASDSISYDTGTLTLQIDLDDLVTNKTQGDIQTLFQGGGASVTDVFTLSFSDPLASLATVLSNEALIGGITNSVSIRLAKKRVISHLIHMPASPFAVLNQQRLWMPYFFTSDTTPTRRKFTDELIATDILDYNTVDPIGQNFRIASGGDDFIVGIEPFSEDTILVFCRKSIYRLGGTSGSLADCNLSVVTPELGCAARRTIIQVGNKVYFLSDNGIYGLEYLDEYNLRGLELPLSEAINPIISRINTDSIDKAVGRYHDNRLWFAVPLDGARENNMILVYNLLNQGWESVDQVDSSDFNVRDMIVAQEGAKNKIYITTVEGGVHEIDGFDGGDQISVSAGVSIPETLDINSKLVSREYDADTIDRKNFARAELHIKSADGLVSNADISFTTTDPDGSRGSTSIRELLTPNADLPAGEDASLRTRIRLRGFGCTTTVTPTEGRPIVRAIKLDARVTDRSTTSTT